MASNEQLEQEIADLKIAVQGMFGMLKHLTVEIGDFSHTLSEVGSQFMTRMGFIWESLGGKVVEENEPDSDKEPDEEPGAEVIPLRPRDSEEPADA
jgi:hypothetical protein